MIELSNRVVRVVRSIGFLKLMYTTVVVLVLLALWVLLELLVLLLVPASLNSSIGKSVGPHRKFVLLTYHINTYIDLSLIL